VSKTSAKQAMKFSRALSRINNLTQAIAQSVASRFVKLVDSQFFARVLFFSEDIWAVLKPRVHRKFMQCDFSAFRFHRFYVRKHRRLTGQPSIKAKAA
jgi:hypothetical protein